MLLLPVVLACTAPKDGPPPDTGAPDTATDSGDTGDDSGDTEPPCDPDPAEALERIITGQGGDCDRAWYFGQLDLQGAGAGPWVEDLWMDWTEDARTFDLSDAVRLRTSAAVPEIVKDDDGRSWIFFVDGDLDRARQVAESSDPWMNTHGLLGWGALSAMVSDDGVTFEDVPDFAVVDIVHGMVVDPDILRLPDGRWRLYYVGLTVEELLSPDAWVDQAPHTLYYAESDDLVTWEQVGVAAVGPNADPSVYCRDDGTCLLTSTGCDWGYSTDGGATFEFEVRQDPWGFAPEFFDLGDGRLRLFYNSKVRGGAIDAWASDDDGATWAEEGQRVPERIAEAVTFAPAPQGGWYVYYHYWQDGYSGDSWGDGDEDTGDTATP